MRRLDWVRKMLEDGRKVDLVSETELEILEAEYEDRLVSRPSTANAVRSEAGGGYWTARLKDDEAATTRAQEGRGGGAEFKTSERED